MKSLKYISIKQQLDMNQCKSKTTPDMHKYNNKNIQCNLRATNYTLLPQTAASISFYHVTSCRQSETQIPLWQWRFHRT